MTSLEAIQDPGKVINTPGQGGTAKAPDLRIRGGGAPRPEDAAHHCVPLRAIAGHGGTSAMILVGQSVAADSGPTREIRPAVLIPFGVEHEHFSGLFRVLRRAGDRLPVGSGGYAFPGMDGKRLPLLR